MMWRVDNGSENRVRDDCWVPYDTPRPVLVCEDSASGNMMASELIDQNYVRWNEEEIICVLWALWKARNLLVFKVQKMDPMAVVEMGCDICREFWSANKLSGINEEMITGIHDHWRRAVGNKLNTDAVIFVNNGVKIMEAGFVLRDAYGEMIWAG
ncbi:Uncharacterized protein TCM_032673 [Theobroma cacao]|uniref:Uncharacterized protein n=1 Tax=Theobroma cacao TaxID=3641 RepID=A0A061F991_THECC|nr:Uncharacterized protein TCM_032673 [Theobroma cacao]